MMKPLGFWDSTIPHLVHPTGSLFRRRFRPEQPKWSEGVMGEAQQAIDDCYNAENYGRVSYISTNERYLTLLS